MSGADPSDAIAAWLVEAGLAGAGETALLNGFCERMRDSGFSLSRGQTIVDTLHPVYEGRLFRWRDEAMDEPAVLEYGRTTEGEAADNWRRNMFYHMLTEEASELRLPVNEEVMGRFSQMAPVGQEGHTELLALIHRFERESMIGEMDCIYSYWCTRSPGGFTDPELSALRRLVPILALAIKCASLARVAGTLVEVYLGRDAGQRVLSGRILRGVAEPISAVLWFSDLEGYTRISDTAAPQEIIPLLNDYADAVISAVHDAGGDVLKLIGDGILAIFKAEDRQEACRCALAAETALRERLSGLNRQRTADGRPTTNVYLGLHIGEVYFGNIGSVDRLDFTVVGPAVNEASRIASMCRSADRDVLMSADFVAAAGTRDRARCVSVGRYALRGVSRVRELYTLEPADAT